MGKVISVILPKGGVGKTTLALNVAAAAHLAGKNTLLVDLDQQGSALDWYAARANRPDSKLAGLSTVKSTSETSKKMLSVHRT